MHDSVNGLGPGVPGDENEQMNRSEVRMETPDRTNGPTGRTPGRERTNGPTAEAGNERTNRPAPEAPGREQTNERTNGPTGGRDRRNE